jgi:hypothetical protein
MGGELVAVPLTQIALCTAWSALKQSFVMHMKILAKYTEYANKNMLAVSGDKIEEDKLHSL